MEKYKIDSTDPNYIKILAIEDIPSGEKIGIWVTDYPTEICRYLFQEGMAKKWYETFDLGRYCNHSDISNTRIELDNNEIVLISTGILISDEITTDYNNITQFTGYIPKTNF